MPVTPFAIHRIQVFDERMEMWVDLVSSSQLTDYCQIYVFQKENPWHKDCPGRIPPPVRLSQPLPQSFPVAPPMATMAPVPAVPVPAMHPIMPAVASPPAVLPVHQSPLPSYTDSIMRQRHIPLNPVPTSPPVTTPPVLDVARGVSPQRLMHAAPVPLPLVDEMTALHMQDAVVTHTDKVRFVYDELDVRKTRTVSFDDWDAMFHKYRLNQPDGVFSADTAQELFTKADKNEDGIVTFAEYQLFAELYPKLLDSLFYRCRDQVHHDARRKNIESAESVLQDLDKRRDDAEQEYADAQQAVLDAEQKDQSVAQGLEAAKEAEKEAKQQKEDSHAQTEEVRSRLRQVQSSRDRCKESIRQKDSLLRSAQRGVETAEKKERSQENEVGKARKELERIRRLLEAQEKEVQRQEALLADATQGIAVARDKVAEQETQREQLDKELNHAQADVQTVEDELRSSLDNENVLSQQHRDAVRETNQLQSARQHEEQELAKEQAREAQRKAALERAIRSLEEHQKVVEALHEKDRDLCERRAAEEGRENELLESEVRLREQRENMEKKEMALREAHMDFTAEAGRFNSASPVGRFARDPSLTA
eukprot:TRINITY_DN21273_c0_g1_i1.p2 TRINITY_DN21273_c0_g1~~TRINITY_DN21273_c0_g1_i1.p2  ORF type:complete len:664 (+),score=313.28 TRINITY_DN21273_c0_g1_i1:215-1993(+)